MVNRFEAGDAKVFPQLRRLLELYGEQLAPWAKRVAKAMLNEVNARDLDKWREHSDDISEELLQEILFAPIGQRMHELLDLQVHLITSLPTKAAQRVHDLTTKALIDGTRFNEIADEIMRTGQVTESRAILIARTEVARTAAALTRARAEHAGSTHYQWLTAEDDDVRPGHKKMNRRVFEWANPPWVDEGDGRMIQHHPGEIWNCRCVALPLFGEVKNPRRRSRRR